LPAAGGCAATSGAIGELSTLTMVSTAMRALVAECRERVVSMFVVSSFVVLLAALVVLLCVQCSSGGSKHRPRFVRASSMSKQIGHQAHRAVDVLKEYHVAGAETVQPRLAARRGDEAILRALPVTREAHRTSLRRRSPFRKRSRWTS
jgi:hypothetical protein